MVANAKMMTIRGKQLESIRELGRNHMDLFKLFTDLATHDYSDEELESRAEELLDVKQMRSVAEGMSSTFDIDLLRGLNIATMITLAYMLDAPVNDDNAFELGVNAAATEIFGAMLEKDADSEDRA